MSPWTDKDDAAISHACCADARVERFVLWAGHPSLVANPIMLCEFHARHLCEAIARAILDKGEM